MRRILPYRFKAGETVPENIRRLVNEEVDFAIGELRGSSVEKRDEAIHEARKSIKKLRGVLKLIRSELVVEEVRTDRSLADRYAELLPKDGDRVQDQRFFGVLGVAVNLVHDAKRTDESSSGGSNRSTSSTALSASPGSARSSAN